jgi:hypothetical protein
MEHEQRVIALLKRMQRKEFEIRNAGFGDEQEMRNKFNGFTIQEIGDALKIFNDKELWSSFLFSLVYGDDSL